LASSETLTSQHWSEWGFYHHPWQQIRQHWAENRVHQGIAIAEETSYLSFDLECDNVKV